MKSKAKKLIFWIITAYFIIVAGLYLSQRSLIYFPQGGAPNIASFTALGIDIVETKTSDGLTLNAWYKQPDGGKEIIVFFHGNASNHAMSAAKVISYLDRGYGFLSVGYRGYNGNAGNPSEQGFYIDSRAWINYLKNKGFEEENLILVGQSIGTGVAVQMALEYQKIKSLILESPYTSLPDVAASSFPFIPLNLLMKDQFDSLSKIKEIKAPLLVIQGGRDKVISPLLSRKLYNAANDPKKIIIIEEAGHNNISLNKILEDVLQFISQPQT